MNCDYQKHIPRWVDGEPSGISKVDFESHLSQCSVCREEVQALQQLNQLIFSSAPSLELSANFDGIFWQKVLERQKESPLSRLLRQLDSLIPTPNFAQAWGVLLLALLIGGAGGFAATAGTILPEQMEAKRTSVNYLSGFQEFGGVPSSSVAASYLKTLSKRSDR